MTEIELVVERLFEESKTDVSLSQYIQYYPSLIARIKELEEQISKGSKPEGK